MDYNVVKQAEEQAEIIPEHECAGGDCLYTGGFYMLGTVDKERGRMAMSSGAHGIDPRDVIAGVVETIDRMILASRDPDTPEIIAVAMGREAMKDAIDKLPMPDGVDGSVEDFLTAFLEGIADGEDL